LYYRFSSESKLYPTSEEVKTFKKTKVPVRLQILFNSEHIVRAYPGNLLLKNIVRMLELEHQDKKPNEYVEKVYRIYGTLIPLESPIFEVLDQDDIIIIETK
jgi:hypothetical protein